TRRPATDARSPAAAPPPRAPRTGDRRRRQPRRVGHADGLRGRQRVRGQLGVDPVDPRSGRHDDRRDQRADNRRHPGNGLADDAAARIEELERRWSRFLPTSEVSTLTANAGHAVEVSRETTQLVDTAIAAWRVSGGAVDPTVLGAVLAAGYDRSFETLAAAP